MDHRLLRTLAALAATLALTGCAGVGRQAGPPGPVYPPSPDRLETLDIQVLQLEREVEFTNTTAVRFGPSRLWLNAWYSAPVEGVQIGETVRMPLTAFRDEHGDHPRAGGFFATEAPELIVLAELETDEGFHRMVVIPRRTD